MPAKRIELGGNSFPGVLCAPLAGYTDFAFRKLCYSFGAGMCFTEMVSAKGLFHNSAATRELLLQCPEEKGRSAAQLFGSDPDCMRLACESEDLAAFPVVDLNMGCPVPKVYKNGEGSALLGNLPLAEKIIAACAKSGKTVTVKFRIGLRREEPVAAEFARMCEGAGASMITVHGRPRESYYSGEPDFGQIAAAKGAVKIPVIANGGIFSPEDGEKMLDRTGADGVMLARGALQNPHLFAEFAGAGKKWDILGAVRAEAADMLPVYGERRTVVRMRKMAAFYIRGLRGAAEARQKLFECATMEEVETVLIPVLAEGEGD